MKWAVGAKGLGLHRVPGGQRVGLQGPSGSRARSQGVKGGPIESHGVKEWACEFPVDQQGGLMLKAYILVALHWGLV